MTPFRFLFKYLAKAKFLVIWILLIFLLMISLMRSQQYIVAQMVGLITENQKSAIGTNLLFYLSILGVVLLVLSACEGVRRYLEAKIVPYFNSYVAKDLFAMVHKHSLSFFEEEMAGNIAGKVSSLMSNIENMYFNITFGVIIPVTEIFISLIFIGLQDVRLALILGVLNLIFLVITILFRKQITPYSMERARLSSLAHGIFVDGVTNASLVKSFSNYFYEKHLFFKAVRNMAEAHKKEFLKSAYVHWASKSVFDIMTIISYALIFYFWYRYGLTVAGVVFTTSVVSTFIGAVRSMGQFATSFAQVYGAIKDGLNLLNRPYQVTDKPHAVKFKPKSNKITFEDVTFSYPNGTSVFKNFNLCIKPNQKIGLVGHSGSGKSSLIKLLVRYYNVCSGSIKIGDVDISSVTQLSLRKQIGLIPQESTLFNRTILENIRYGNPKATDRQVISAAKKAYIHDFIMSLPEGYNSKVGDRGVMLSGGERQRIAIARAILKNAPVLILDEATSALDSQSEQYIQQSLKTLMQNKTVIAIAHRLSTLKEMDELLVLEKGKITERGSHHQLLKRGGAYAKFYKIQSTALKK